jgi:hypothetical protein
MNLTVFPVPVISMIGEKITCGIKTRTLNINFEGVDENVIANGQMEWNSNNQHITLSNKTITSTDIEVTEWGNYNVSFTFTTPDGCKVSDSYTLHFAIFPHQKLNLRMTPTTNAKHTAAKLFTPEMLHQMPVIFGILMVVRQILSTGTFAVYHWEFINQSRLFRWWLKKMVAGAILPALKLGQIPISR